MSTSSKFLIAIMIVGVCVLGGLSIAGNSKSDAARRAAVAAEETTRIAQQNTARTECIRAISSEIDHAHWTLIGQLINASDREHARLVGRQLAALPLTQDIANHGGAVLTERFDKCPAVPDAKKPAAASTTAALDPHETEQWPGETKPTIKEKP